MITQNNYYKNWQDQTFSHLGLFFLGNYKFVRSVGKMSHYRARCSNKFWTEIYISLLLNFCTNWDSKTFLCFIGQFSLNCSGLSVLTKEAAENFDSKHWLNSVQFSVLFRWVFRQFRLKFPFHWKTWLLFVRFGKSWGQVVWNYIIL